MNKGLNSSKGKAQMLLVLVSLGPVACDESRSTPKEPATRSDDAASLNHAMPRRPEVAEPIDLLRHATDSVVTSSHKDEASLGEFMLDGIATTSWQPNPPDPDPWIDVHFSNGVKLTRIAITLDAESDRSGALQISLMLDGKKLGQYALHAANYQLPSPTSAGTLRILFHRNKSGVPVAVQDIGFWGIAPGHERWDAMVPESHVQARARHGERSAGCTTNAPFARLDEVCASCVKELRESKTGNYRDVECKAGPTLDIKGKRPRTVDEVRWVELAYSDEFDSYTDSFLAFHMLEGWSVSAISSKTEKYMGSCPGMSDGGVVQPLLAWREGLFVAEQIRWFYRGRMATDEPPTSAVRALRVCEFEQKPLCREYVVAFGYPVASFSQDPEQPSYDPITGPPTSWVWERDYEIRQDGVLRFTPCQAGTQTSEVVPCLAPGFSSLL